jgi:OOP family OmpA-OmpF porin
MVAAFAFLLPLSARSEIKAGSFEVNPFVGYNFFENRQNLKDAPVFGLRAGYNFTKYFGIEGTGEFINSRVDDRAKMWTKEGQFTSPIDSVDITMYHLDLIYHIIPEGNFNPFIVAGYGGAHYSPKRNTRDMAIFDFGVGAKYWVTDNIAFRADLRDNMVYDEKIHNIVPSLGVVFAFGGKAKPAPTPAKYEPIPEPKPEPEPIPRVEQKVEEAPAPVVVVVETPAQKVEKALVILNDQHFEFDKSNLTKEGMIVLKKNSQVLKDNPLADVRIAGYASASGTVKYNQRLSERRATSVRDYLIKEGVAPERLTTIGYGKSRPATVEANPADINSPAARSNMRVVFEVTIK